LLLWAFSTVVFLLAAYPWGAAQEADHATLEAQKEQLFHQIAPAFLNRPSSVTPPQKLSGFP
jgi:hypothetical protein